MPKLGKAKTIKPAKQKKQKPAKYLSHEISQRIKAAQAYQVLPDGVEREHLQKICKLLKRLNRREVSVKKIAKLARWFNNHRYGRLDIVVRTNEEMPTLKGIEFHWGGPRTLMGYFTPAAKPYMDFIFGGDLPAYLRPAPVPTEFVWQDAPNLAAEENTDQDHATGE